MRNHRRSNKNPLFRAWSNMRTRCRVPSTRYYSRYGGRGIDFCDRWSEFTNFADDMGDSFEKGLALDRKDNNGDYTPDNCRWATRKEQAINRSSTQWITNPETGETKTLTDWSIDRGIPRTAICSRIRLGYTEFSDVMADKLPRWNERPIVDPSTGETKNISQWCDELGVPRDRVYARYESGVRVFGKLFDPKKFTTGINAATHEDRDTYGGD